MMSHEPSPEFRAHLEWQIETAMRRESRLAEPVTASAPSGWLRTAIVVLVALAIGGAAGIASERVQDAKTRDQLVENAKSERALLKTRLELARAELQEAQRRFETGMVDRDTLNEAKARVAAAEHALARLEVDVQEIQKTAAPPRDDLNAPRVGDQDFVRERLKLELAQAEQELRAAEAGLAKARQRFEVGTGTNASLLQADIELAVARNHLQQIRIRMELREKYLQDQLSAEQLAEQLRRTALTLDSELTRQQLAVAKRRVDTLKAQVEIGTMSPLDLKRAEVEMLELEAKFKRIQQQLAAAGKKEE